MAVTSCILFQIKMTEYEHHSLDISDAMDTEVAEEECDEVQTKEVPVHELSSTQLNVLDPFR
jgi:hypothetical protein